MSTVTRGRTYELADTSDVSLTESVPLDGVSPQVQHIADVIYAALRASGVSLVNEWIIDCETDELLKVAGQAVVQMIEGGDHAVD